MADQPRQLPIGLFDSGVGGLSVLTAVHRRLPKERLLYLGDSARVPYGTKSTEDITRYTLQAAAELVERGIKALVVACNTATIAALEPLRREYPHLPIFGVVNPGARAAAAASKTGHILVLATESTINSKAYHKAVNALSSESRVSGLACSLFVSLVEEGWADSAVVDPYTGKSIAESIAAYYLKPFFHLGPTGRDPAVSSQETSQPGKKIDIPDCTDCPDCIVLGCTHFPPLATAIQRVVGAEVAIVDPAVTTAETVAERLGALNLLFDPQSADLPAGRLGGAGNETRNASANGIQTEPGQVHFLTTAGLERFQRVGSLFVGRPIRNEELELVRL